MNSNTRTHAYPSAEPAEHHPSLPQRHKGSVAKHGLADCSHRQRARHVLRCQWRPQPDAVTTRPTTFSARRLSQGCDWYSPSGPASRPCPWPSRWRPFSPRWRVAGTPSRSQRGRLRQYVTQLRRAVVDREIAADGQHVAHDGDALNLAQAVEFRLLALGRCHGCASQPSEPGRTMLALNSRVVPKTLTSSRRIARRMAVAAADLPGKSPAKPRHRSRRPFEFRKPTQSKSVNSSSLAADSTNSSNS